VILKKALRHHYGKIRFNHSRGNALGKHKVINSERDFSKGRSLKKGFFNSGSLN
jgi:hypothetical protein